MAREKKPVHKVQMIEEKWNIIQDESKSRWVLERVNEK